MVIWVRWRVGDWTRFKNVKDLSRYLEAADMNRRGPLVLSREGRVVGTVRED